MVSYLPACGEDAWMTKTVKWTWRVTLTCCWCCHDQHQRNKDNSATISMEEKSCSCFSGTAESIESQQMFEELLWSNFGFKSEISVMKAVFESLQDTILIASEEDRTWELPPEMCKRDALLVKTRCTICEHFEFDENAFSRSKESPSSMKSLNVLMWLLSPLKGTTWG